MALLFTFGGRPRLLVGRGWATAIVSAAGAVLLTWCLGATVYLVFHDQLLATLMARQTAAQYDYEDRIAALSMQLDQQTSRALLDRQALDATVRNFQDRSERLMKRAGLIDDLVTRERAFAGAGPLLGAAGPGSPMATHSSSRPGFEEAPLRGGDLARSKEDGARCKEDQSCSGEDAARRGENEPGRRAQAETDATQLVAARLAEVEQRQTRVLAALRDPAVRRVAKLKTALIEAGVSLSSARTRDVGGPFVPLTAAATAFEEDAALVQDTLLQAHELTALADRVPLRRPVSGPLEVTSSFGPRLDPFWGRPALHTGVDLRSATGTEVHATAAGTVSLAASEGGYGTMVEVNHGNGLVTRYAHLVSASVTPGQRVEAGDVIGRVGSTGRATGPHLHYETRVNGEPVDPTRFLKAGAKLFEAS